MISSLRILSWRAWQCAKLVLRDKCAFLNARTANSGNIHKGNSGVQKYLLERQAITVQKTILGGSRRGNQTGSAAPREGHVSGVLISQRPVANLLGRVGPLLSGAIRRLSTQRSSNGSYPVFIRNSAPLFALVGVTLVATEDELASDKARSSNVKVRGFVTREEELEAICGSIRNAIEKSGWLESLQSDMPSKKRAPAASLEGSAAPQQQYSLQDLDIGGVIDKGCNAAVYAARWIDDCNNDPEAGPSTVQPEHSRPDPDAHAAQVNMPSYQSSGSFLRASPFHCSNLNLHSMSPLDETIARTVSVEALFDSRPAQNDVTAESNLSSLSLVAPETAHTPVEATSTSAAALALSTGQFGRPCAVRPKKVSFNVPSNEDSNGNDDLSPPSDYELPKKSGAPSDKFPLAVKLVFNYEAASNAPAILSALYRELLPARCLQLHAPRSDDGVCDTVLFVCWCL
ncbi:hypothetical protein FHG87_017856 [Trinorchestia longiramus]|nr:hypothetical protein FHG87_017856 [Trinorchestia longiramus]